MAAPTITDLGTIEAGGAGDSFVSVTASAGDFFVVGIMQWSADNRTYQVDWQAPDPDETFTLGPDSQSSYAQHAEIHYLDVVTGGTGNVYVAPNTSTNWDAQLWRVEGTDLTKGGEDTNEGSNGTAHDCGATGITTQADTALFCAAVMTNDASSLTQGTGYTKVHGRADQLFAQHQASATVLTSNTGDFTSGASNRAARGAMLEIYDAGGGGAAHPVGPLGHPLRGALGGPIGA